MSVTSSPFALSTRRCLPSNVRLSIVKVSPSASEAGAVIVFGSPVVAVAGAIRRERERVARAGDGDVEVPSFSYVVAADVRVIERMPAAPGAKSR